uniref:Uncharacterized protein n=1 Tax=Cajanus cajan TaxID=3821 RepID=A0A151SXW5_CAJCA|nr:hypothetical protein KK1_015065 [Cajanus cajan]
MRPSNHKPPRRVKVENGFLIKVLLRNHGLDHMLFEISSNLIVCHSLIMLMTCVLPSGLNQGHVPFFRTSVRRAPSLDLAVVGVKTNVVRHKSYVPACVTHDLFVVHVGLGCDFTEHHHHVGLGAGFASNLAVWVLLQARIEHSVRDLVAELVRVTLVHRFGCE